jgi:ribosomal protein S18 acetylase RimI-like enzyme
MTVMNNISTHEYALECRYGWFIIAVMTNHLFRQSRPLGNGVSLVRMTRGHIEAAAKIMAEAEPWNSYGFDFSRISDFLAGSIRADIARTVIEGAAGKGTVAGVVIVQPGFLGGRFLEILALDEKHRGRGLGRRVIDEICREMPAHMRDLFVLVAETNAPAVAFYRKLGFMDVGDMPGLIRPGKTDRLIWLRFR